MEQIEVDIEDEILSLLTEISEMILELDNSSRALDRIVELTTERFQADSGSIAVPDFDDEQLRIISSYDHDSCEVNILNSRQALDLDEGVAGKAYSEGSMYQAEDINQDSNFKSVLDDGEEEYRSIITIPLVAKGECIGVLNLCFSQKTKISSCDVSVLNIVANQIAITMTQMEMKEELEQDNRELKRLALTDGLTGLPNHRSIQGKFRRELKRARRYDNTLSLVMLDIDYFKKINDTYGHPAGDQVLKDLANIFEDMTRDVDSVGRYGGEEFLFVLPETGPKGARRLAERIRRRIESRPFVVPSGKKVDVTISAGISSYQPGDEQVTADELLARADAALYDAKRRGRNRCWIDSENYTTCERKCG